jgi:N-acetylglucosaminyldiphosphoundecaprenol N-acetyl-beta-D-mannosaminyltransferase
MRQTPANAPAPVEAFGFRVNPGTIAEYVEFTAAAIAARRRLLLFDHNLHSLYLFFRSPDLRRLYQQSAAVMIDGMPIVLLLRLAGYPARRAQRVTWVDYLWPLLRRAESEGWHVFYIGSDPVTHERALAEIRKQLPRLVISGRHGFFDATAGSADNRDIVTATNTFGTDLCLVGMGTPRQQHWMAAHRDALDDPVMAFCGGCMEFVAGTAPTPPRWTGRLGLEWMYRLVSNPRRFAFRYLVEPVLLAGSLLRHWQMAAVMPSPADADNTVDRVE